MLEVQPQDGVKLASPSLSLAPTPPRPAACPPVRRFSAPKRLVSDAAPTDGPASHSIADVELLLRLCDLLLWPHALHSWRIGGPASRADSDDEEDGGAGALAPAFVDAWLQFLGGIHRSIKALLPEDQAVKALANQLEITYREMAAGPKAGMSHLASP